MEGPARKPDLLELKCIEGESVIVVVTESTTIGISRTSLISFITASPTLKKWGGIPNIGYLELNTTDKTLDLIVFAKGKYSREALASFAWPQVNHEFLDALHCANQRIRSWV